MGRLREQLGPASTEDGLDPPTHDSDDADDNCSLWQSDAEPAQHEFLHSPLFYQRRLGAGVMANHPLAAFRRVQLSFCRAHRNPA